MDEKTVDAMFVLARELLLKHRAENCRLPYMLRITQKALTEGDEELWKLASLYQ